MERRPHGFLTTLLVGLFSVVLPLMILQFLLRQAIDYLWEPSQQLAKLLPIMQLTGPVLDLAVAILLLAALAYLAGLLVMSGRGRQWMIKLHDRPIMGIPPFNLVRGMAASFAPGEQEVAVVLVPSDQGQTLAFVFGPIEGERVCVFVPSAPNWTSGSISFARREDVEMTGLSFAEATRLLMQMGGRKEVTAHTLKMAEWKGPAEG